ncbi:hypothetical protein [Pseudaminobacter soli (ex Li et al. 2025)]|uniref:Uncharacterized protein n=1 Tax=Pseudaminobacter soli (ex Li et al. 2025) TaxID=1295366 RepID=A0A2P7S2Y2_9HYPH|nr:hypothetical protein [Mesorhizobium soli]PSJ56835.1 hypothetical protein C7I85_23395 [Mesorhizobium soli]
MTASSPEHFLRVMPREMRLMSERIFSMTGQPKGFFLAVQDMVMYSQKLGLGGFALLEKRFESLRNARPEKTTVLSEQGSAMRFDGGGQHAWFVLPALIDLLGELAARFGEAEITVVNVVDPDELKIATGLGGRTGLAVTFEDRATFRVKPRPIIGAVKHDDPLLWDVLENGLQIEAELWWRIYYLAKKALAPDSVVSRRHAGPMIVNPDGTVIGRKDNDDDTDISFLMKPRALETQTESTNS